MRSRQQQRVLAGETVVNEVQRQRKDGSLVTVGVSAAQVVGDEEGPAAAPVHRHDRYPGGRGGPAGRPGTAGMVLTSGNAVIYALRVEGTALIPTWVSENLTRITGYQPARSTRAGLVVQPSVPRGP